MTDLAGKVVLVTGAGGGFGQVMASQLLAAGSELVLADVDAHALRGRTSVALQVAGQEHNAERILGYVEADLATSEGPVTLYSAARTVAPRIDVLVNNAGMAMSGRFLDVPRERWEALLQVNLLAAMRLTALFVPEMVERRSGHIVNMSSVAGLVGAPGLVAYSVSKFGLRGLTESLAGELRPFGVSVTGVYPFFARTPILDSPHYGSAPRGTLPAWLIDDPAMVMRAMVRGIERNRVHVYPGATARLVDTLRRVAPWVLPAMPGRDLTRGEVGLSAEQAAEAQPASGSGTSPA